MSGVDVTQEVIGKAVGMSPQGLKKYPVVAEFLRQYTAAQEEQRQRYREAQEAQLLQQACEAAAQLQARGRRVSGRAIARELGIAWSSLWAYPTICARLRIESRAEGQVA